MKVLEVVEAVGMSGVEISVVQILFLNLDPEFLLLND